MWRSWSGGGHLRTYSILEELIQSGPHPGCTFFRTRIILEIVTHARMRTYAHIVYILMCNVCESIIFNVNTFLLYIVICRMYESANNSDNMLKYLK